MGAPARWREVLEAKANMPLSAFLRFAQDFDVLPRLVSMLQLVSAFKSSRFEGDGPPEQVRAARLRVGGLPVRALGGSEFSYMLFGA
jgi:hypothetical protein